MQIKIESEVYNGDPVQVLAFFIFLSHSRHLLLIDERDGDFQKWLGTLTATQQQAVISQVRSSIALAIAQNPTTEITINQTDDNWDNSPPRITIHSAWRYLQIPFRLFVENSKADRAFLLSFMQKSDAEKLMQFENNGWFQVIHGGGLGDLDRLVRSEHRLPGVKHRIFVLFDSDRLSPTDTSPAPEALKAYCGRKDIKHHQLTKRAIENYIPLYALATWCQNKAGQRRKYLKRLEALKSLSPEQRSYFNMKKGLSGDQAHERSAGTLFSGVPAARLKLLYEGFGSSISEVYMSSAMVPARAYKDLDNAQAEIFPIAQTIVRMM